MYKYSMYRLSYLTLMYGLCCLAMTACTTSKQVTITPINRTLPTSNTQNTRNLADIEHSNAPTLITMSQIQKTVIDDLATDDAFLTIAFAPRSAAIHSTQLSKLYVNVEYMRLHPTARIQLQAQPDKLKNITCADELLAYKRAAAIKEELMSHGIDELRLYVTTIPRDTTTQDACVIFHVVQP